MLSFKFLDSGGAAIRAYKTLRYEDLNLPKMMKSKGFTVL